MASGFFLKLSDRPEFRGSATLAGHAGWIVVESFSFGAHGTIGHGAGSGLGMPRVDDASLTTKDQACFTGVFRASADGTGFATVLVDIVRDDVVVYRLELTDATISSMSFNGRKDPFMSLSLKFAKLTATPSPGGASKAPARGKG